MNKNEFIDVLEKNLIRLPKADRDDIISDYEAHFALGLENGKTEEEVSASLGDPHELALTYLENLPEGAKGAPAAEAQDEPANDAPAYSAPTYGAPQTAKKAASSSGNTAQKDSPDAGSVVLVVFLSIAAVCALFSIAGAWFALPGIAIGCFAAAFSLIAAGIALVTQSVIAGIGAMLIGLSLIALGILTIIGCIASVKGIIWLVKKFIELCQNILNGGNN